MSYLEEYFFSGFPKIFLNKLTPLHAYYLQIKETKCKSNYTCKTDKEFFLKLCEKYNKFIDFEIFLYLKGIMYLNNYTYIYIRSLSVKRPIIQDRTTNGANFHQ